MASETDHPNLNSDNVVIDKEAIQLIENDDRFKQFFEKWKKTDPRQIKIRKDLQLKFQTAGVDSIKQILFDSLNVHNILYYEDILIYVYTPNNRMYQIVINHLRISSLEFKINKILRNILELKLAIICFNKANSECTRAKEWYSKHGKMVYSDTKFSQFKFSNFQSNEFANIKDLIQRMFRI